jgi:hypothetical protein
MKWTMTRPCNDCPFLTGEHEGDAPIRLTAGRVREIHKAMAESQGSTFACHKTTTHDDDDEHVSTPREQHCAGALLYMMHVNPAWTQMARIASRLGCWNPDKMTGGERVFTSLRAWLATAWDRQPRTRVQAGRRR